MPVNQCEHHKSTDTYVCGYAYYETKQPAVPEYLDWAEQVYLLLKNKQITIYEAVIQPITFSATPILVLVTENYDEDILLGIYYENGLPPIQADAVGRYIQEHSSWRYITYDSGASPLTSYYTIPNNIRLPYRTAVVFKKEFESGGNKRNLSIETPPEEVPSVFA